MAYSKAKLNSNGDRASPHFTKLLTRNMPDKLVLALPVSWDIKLNEKIIQDFSPNSILSFLEVYKELMHCFIVFPFFQVFDKCRIYRVQQKNLTVFKFRYIGNCVCVGGGGG